MDDAATVGNGLFPIPEFDPTARPAVPASAPAGHVAHSPGVLLAASFRPCTVTAIVIRCLSPHGDTHATYYRSHRRLAGARQRGLCPDLREEEFQLQQVRQGRVLRSRD